MTMLKIASSRTLAVPILVDFDPFIPVTVRTSAKPIGAVFYRVGNFKTSLVEIPIDPATGTVRGVKLVSMDQSGDGIEDSKLPVSEGLPVVPLEAIPQEREDDIRKVTVSLIGARLFIDWSNGQIFGKKIRQGRLTFLIGNEVLLGAVIEEITETESEVFRKHLPPFEQDERV